MKQTQKIEAFLIKVDKSFPVPLSNKQNLKDFAIKLNEKATICIKEENGEILSMVAGYTESLENNIAYISVVATLENARGKGYAKALVKDFINICKKKRIKAVHLYTVATNLSAVKMYKSIGFGKFILENEPRKNDLHLIYYIKEE